MVLGQDAAHSLGLRAETIAALRLRLKFYKILARRYRAQGGEVDVVDKRGRTIVFVHHESALHLGCHPTEIVSL